MAQILRDYQLKDADTALTMPNFPYFALLRVAQKNSNKSLRKYSELALEMNLLRLELGNIKTSKNPEQIRSILLDFSNEFSNEQFRYILPRYIST